MYNHVNAILIKALFCKTSVEDSGTELIGCASASGGCGSSVCCKQKPRDTSRAQLESTSGVAGAHGNDGNSASTNQTPDMKQIIDF